MQKQISRDIIYWMLGIRKNVTVYQGERSLKCGGSIN